MNWIESNWIEVVFILSGIVTILAFVINLEERRRARKKAPRPVPEAELIKQYMARLVDLYGRLDFKGLGQQVAHRLSVHLDAVYVPASTVTTESQRLPTLTASPHTGLLVREDSSTVPLSSFLDDCPRVVVLGPAGAGKTTFLTHMCLTLAEGFIARDPDLVRQRLKVTWKEPPIPIYLALRDFGYYLSDGVPSPQETAGAGAVLLLNYMSQYLSQVTGIQFPSDFFTTLLNGGRCIFLLDGLDEIADFKLRAFATDIIANLVMTYSRNRYIISSRPEAYGGPASMGSDFHVFNIHEFSYADIVTFVERWHFEVARYKHRGNLDSAARREAEDGALDLLRAINTSQEVRQLAGNPLLLTSIAIIHYSNTMLPQRRAELYELCTRILLGDWDIAKVGAAAKRRPWYPGFDDMSAEARRTQLEYVAFHMLNHQEREAGGDDLGRMLAVESSRFRVSGDLDADTERACDFLRAVAMRGGVLEEKRDQRYSFSHQSFQEYLGARRLARLHTFITFALDRIGDSWWREVIRLVVGHLSPSDPERTEALISAIAETPEREESLYHNLLLAADCLIDADRTALNVFIQQGIRDRLLATMEDVNAPLNVRVSAGLALGWLGDPRDLGAMIEVPSGPFMMGSDQRANEQPIYAAQLPSFAIARYPVTNEQYSAFIAARGYQTRAFWTTEGWSWLQDKQVTQPFYWDDPKYHAPNQPVVGVSWYEAMAYCRWANKRLPTEAEWEKAARGETGRMWPWGDIYQTNLCNSEDSRIGMPSPVGLFGHGASPYGALDMAGNVWEWCSSMYASYRYTPTDGREEYDKEGSRVLRGGSWYSSAGEARGAMRRWLHPGARQFNFGFRIVAL